jgi:hypothetical protein
MAKASGDKAARCSSDSLMRLGAVRDVVLARVPLDAHRALGQTCKALRRLVYSDGFAKLRKTLGCEEFGLLLLAGSVFSNAEGTEGRRKQLVCLTHNLESLGFAAVGECPLDMCEFTAALSTDGRLVVCGDANWGRKGDRKVLVYDTRQHVWVRDSRYPAILPVIMFGQCTAFLDNTLVVVGGGTDDEDEPWGFSWDEHLRMWQSLPPVPTAVTHPAYGVIGSRLFVVGGYSCDVAHTEHYGGDGMCDYSARLQIFDATTQSWSLGPPLTQLQERLEFPTSSVAYENRFYVFCQRALDHGSDDNPRSILASSPCHVYCFDPLSNSWSELPAVPTIDSLSDLQACLHDGRLIVAGMKNFDPENAGFFEAEPSTYMYEWDDRAETWKEQPLLLDVRAWPAGRLASLVSVPLRIR